MDTNSDTYRTLSKVSDEVLYKEKKSKFIGNAFPIQSEEEVKPIITSLKKKHPSAGHVCYAWQLGVEQIRYRANDDGEPNNSAGLPIYGQIQAFEITNVLVTVTRIYGGTKLGVGGLIAAYRTAAQMTLDAAQIIEKTLRKTFMLSFGYDDIDKVMRIIKQQDYEIISQKLELTCSITISIKKNQATELEPKFQELHKVKIKEGI